MSIHALILTLLATLSPPSSPPNKDDQPRGPKPLADQHFCCAETWNDGSKLFSRRFARAGDESPTLSTNPSLRGGNGDDCETIDKSDIKTCRIGGGAVLYCGGSWDQDTGGTVTCG